MSSREGTVFGIEPTRGETVVVDAPSRKEELEKNADREWGGELSRKNVSGVGDSIDRQNRSKKKRAKPRVGGGHIYENGGNLQPQSDQKKRKKHKGRSKKTQNRSGGKCK